MGEEHIPRLYYFGGAIGSLTVGVISSSRAESLAAEQEVSREELAQEVVVANPSARTTQQYRMLRYCCVGFNNVVDHAFRARSKYRFLY